MSLLRASWAQNTCCGQMLIHNYFSNPFEDVQGMTVSNTIVHKTLTGVHEMPQTTWFACIVAILKMSIL